MTEYLAYLVDRAAGRLGGMTKQKRGYSREFTPKTDRRVRFEVDRIPPTLFDAVKAKAKRQGVSLRNLTLTLWREWSERPDEACDRGDSL